MQDIAKILNVSSSVYSRWERNIITIPTKRLYELANFYNVNIDFLLGLTNSKTYIKSKKINYSIICKNIREIRKDYNETLRTFSNRLNTSNSTWSAYETCNTLILCSFLIKICLNWNYSADWILGKSDRKYIDKILI